MAKVKNNIILQGLSGALGPDLIIKTRNGRTYVSQRPTVKIKPTDRQLKRRQQFQEAMQKTKVILESDEQRAYYQNLLQPKGALYHALVSHFMKETKKSE